MIPDTLREDRCPQPDPAEFDAYFPSPFALARFTSATTGAIPVRYPDRYAGGHWRVLMVATAERYMEMRNGRLFSTGNHPAATLLPAYHMQEAGFAVDIATIGGAPVRLERWAMPWRDVLLPDLYAQFQGQLRRPMTLASAVRQVLPTATRYLAVFLPGGHGAMLGLPGSAELKLILDQMRARRRLIISLSHGSAALMAAAIGASARDFAFRGYTVCAFPEALDRQLPLAGYVPGELPWYLGERLSELGMSVLNKDITGRCHRDRELLTGDSPLAADSLGRMAAQALIEMARLQ